MRFSSLSRALLVAALSTFAVAQEPSSADLKKIRSQAAEAVQAGDYPAAAAGFRKLTEANPKDAQAWHMLGYSLHAAGKLDEALPVHLKATEFPQTAPAATYNVACVHALKGNADQAFLWLEKAVAAGFDDVEQLQRDTDLTTIRKDPRFAKVEAMVKGGPKNPQVQAFADTVDRRNSRVAWFSRNSSPGQITIDWSPVKWKDAMEMEITSGKRQGQKWRLGADFWTRLDTSVDLECGPVVVPAGYYYLTLEQRGENDYVLALHDAAAVRKQKLDAAFANKLQGGIEVPLAHTTNDAVAKELDIALALDQGSKNTGTLTIRFGGHALVTPFRTKLD
jgi:tetratricopeptide (TPR) repeat protein